MARDISGEQRVGRVRRRHTPAPDERLEARSIIETANGPLEVVARSYGDRWWVSAICAGRTTSGVGAELGFALMAALELSGTNAVELER